jgi:hypothetical protein
MLNYLIFFSFDSSVPNQKEMFLSCISACGFEIKQVHSNYVEGIGEKTTNSFIKKMVNQINNLELHINDEIKISYPTVSRIDLNLFPDIETVIIKSKGTIKIAHPFRFSYN